MSLGCHGHREPRCSYMTPCNSMANRILVSAGMGGQDAGRGFSMVAEASHTGLCDYIMVAEASHTGLCDFSMVAEASHTGPCDFSLVAEASTGLCDTAVGLEHDS